MVMSSQTTLHHSSAVREEQRWMEAFMNMILGIMNDTFEESMQNNRKCYAGLSKWQTTVNRSYTCNISESCGPPAA